MKKNIRLTLAVLLCACSSALPAQEKTSYVVFSGDSLTMTFYHDSLKTSRAADAAKVYDLPVKVDNSPDSPWQEDLTRTVTRAVFDASFADARPTLTKGWFCNAEQLEQIEGIEYLNTSEVTSMRYMFCGCMRLRQIDLSHFDTSVCVSFTSMFDGCTSLDTLNIEQFRFREPCDIIDMLNGCTGLTRLRLGSANIEVPAFGFGAFRGVGTQEKPCSLWVRNDFNFEIFDEDSAGNHTYADGIFRIFRYGPEMKQPQHYAVFSPDSTLMTIYCDTLMAERAAEGYCCLMPENGEPAAYSLAETPAEEAAPGMNRASVIFAEPGPVIAKVKEVRWDSSFSKAYPRNMDYWFCNAVSLKSIDGWRLKTNKVTSMKYTFANCCSLEQMPALYTSQVTDMSHLFLNCDKLNNVSFNKLGDWITDKVTDMSSMFEGCRALTDFDASRMKTGNVTDMSGMFKDCRSLERLDLSTVNTKNVTRAAEMFYRAYSLRRLNLGGNDFAHADMTNAFRRTASNYTDSVCSIYVSNAFNREVLAAVPGADYSMWGNGKVSPVPAHLTVGASHVYAITGELACNVLVERTFHAGEWQTLVLPFEVDREQLEAVFGRGTLAARMSGFTGDTLCFNTVSTLPRRTPAIIKPAEAADWPVFENIIVSPSTPGGEEETNASLYDQVGEDTAALLIGLLGSSYQTITASTPYNTLCPSPLMAQKAVNNEVLYNTEAYFFMYTREAEESEPEESPDYDYTIYYDIPIVVNGEGTATGICTAVRPQPAGTTSPAYNLAGQRVGNDYKGIFVRDGRKYIIP